MNTKKWYQSKTIWVGLASVITGIGTWIGGDEKTGLTLIITGLTGIFLRTGLGSTIQ